MNDQLDILAKCLAAEDHPHLKGETGFQEAMDQVEASPELQQALVEARAFLQSHPVLIETDVMPADVRKRILEAMPASEPEGKRVPGPWEIRTQFAWVACLVLLLGAISVYSSYVLRSQAEQEYQVTLANLAPQDAFRSEVGRLLGQSFTLQEHSTSSTQLVSWLGEHGVTDVQMPPRLPEEALLGCAKFESPFGKIGVVCFNVEGDVVHVFMTCAKRVGLKEPLRPNTFRMYNREALQWSDDENLYLMIPERPEADLPEIFL